MPDAPHRPIYPILAGWLSEVLGTSPEFWSNLERKYRSDLEAANA